MKGSRWTMIMNLQDEHTDTPLHPLGPSLLGKPNFLLSFPSLPFPSLVRSLRYSLAAGYVRRYARRRYLNSLPDLDRLG